MKQDRIVMNKGIQAEAITAEVIAVGDNAYAIKEIGHTAHNDLLNIILRLHTAIDELNLDNTARGVVEEDLRKLDNVLEKGKIDKAEVGGILQSMAGKLKMVGVVITETASLVEPVKEMASFLGTTLKSLGLVA